ncbi:uncharacterized protein LOC128725695 [Anopheles nili]|uniref:uncharacterized protein LOC128725695 n=1 Tax=Anopheles nili TaxID=185578 RepID=UPI00237B2470|nr:uncharacterized protein LOC128725695 [Anopheles nili]
MIDNSAAEEEISGVLHGWGYTMNATDYMSSMNNQRRAAHGPGSTRFTVMGRGRGCVDVSRSGLEEIRFAARLNQLEAHNSPMGHLSTTAETLSRNVGPEITATMRSFGICGADEQIGSTRRTVLEQQQDIHIDGNVPVILNGELFHTKYRSVDESENEDQPPTPLVPYDPSLPLEEQFSTIPEFQPQLTATEKSFATIPDETSHLTKAKPAKNKKKQKWTKMPLDIVINTPKPRGRYDIEPEVGRPPVAGNSNYGPRILYGANGTKNLS